MWADRHHSLMKLYMMVFESEYNNEWVSQIKKLEVWVTANDAMLEATKISDHANEAGRSGKVDGDGSMMPLEHIKLGGMLK